MEVTGRTKDLIIRKGEKIAPLELETLLIQHPAVAEVAVVGLPDDERGERVCAVLVTRSRRVRARRSTRSRRSSRAKGLMPQKLPEQVEIVSELPRTGLGKVAKLALRDKFSGCQPRSGVTRRRQATASPSVITGSRLRERRPGSIAETTRSPTATQARSRIATTHARQCHADRRSGMIPKEERSAACPSGIDRPHICWTRYLVQADRICDHRFDFVPAFWGDWIDERTRRNPPYTSTAVARRAGPR